MTFLKTVMLASVLAISTSALAHTGIKSTQPANEQTLETAPKHLTLNFSGSVRLMKVILKDGDDKDLKIDFKPTAKAADSFKIAVPDIENGGYTVSWTAMGKDGHKMTGDFSFLINDKDMSNEN